MNSHSVSGDDAHYYLPVCACTQHSLPVALIAKVGHWLSLVLFWYGAITSGTTGAVEQDLWNNRRETEIWVGTNIAPSKYMWD